MTEEEALARCRARWSRPPPARVDVEERIATRFADTSSPPEVLILTCARSCRLFLRKPDGGWVSRYVHDAAEVDVVLDWLLARIPHIPTARHPEDAVSY